MSVGDESIDNARTIGAQTLIDPQVIVEDSIYIFPDINPSGGFLTSFLNTVFNLVMLRFAAYECVSWDRKKLPLARDGGFVAIAYGDDNAWAVHPELRDDINFLTMQYHLGKLGMTYTPADKLDVDPEPFKNIHDITFLKRSFRFEPILGRYVGPLDLETTL